MTIPDPSLVLLIGAAGSGKSTFAQRHFRGTEILSSDRCRALVCGDPNDQSATRPAFEVLRCILFRRLRMRRLTVIDATNVRSKARKSLLKMARYYEIPAVGIVLNLAEHICVERNLCRKERCVPPHAIWTQSADLRRSLVQLPREGFRVLWILNSPEEVDAVRIERLRVTQDESIYRNSY
ncbi:MAG: AAA family ATPase [Bryobacteraceae bacterium]